MKKKAMHNGVLAALIVGILLVFVVIRLTEADALNRKHKAEDLLHSQASVVERELAMIAERLYSIQSYLIGTAGEYDRIEAVAGYILEDPAVRNVLVAPQSVVAKVLPLAGNEAVVGMNLLSESNKSHQAAIQAIALRQPIFSGPYMLAQGGQAISGRLAIFTRSPGGGESYWGLVSITVAYPEVISKITSEHMIKNEYDFILWEKEPVTGTYKNILEHRQTTKTDFANYEFSAQNLDFRLSVLPQRGWRNITWLVAGIIFAALGTAVAGVTAFMISLTRRRLVEKAGRDSLTGLLNRESGIREIKKRLRRMQFQNGVLALLDIDHFKKINDLMGHPKGDEVLVETAILLQDVTRTSDVVCRLGGDEFLIFFEFEGEPDFVRRKAEGICNRLNRTIYSDTGSLVTTVSVGVSIAQDGRPNFETLYKEADTALYQSKEKGRNRATFYEIIDSDQPAEE